MKWLRNYIDKIKPTFEEGGKLWFLKSTFEAFETFLFTPNKTTQRGAHIRDYVDLKRTMFIVIIALIPSLLFGMFNVGYQYYKAQGISASYLQMFYFGFLKVLPIIIVTYITGLGIEFFFAQIRKHEVNEGFLVTGLLIPLIMPVNVPLWIVAVATAFAVIFGKEVYGGTGMNVFNPALLARAFVFFAYPKVISGDFPWIYNLQNIKVVDGFSGATPLANAAAHQIEKIPDNLTLFIGLIPGSIGETSKIAILLGAFILLFTGVASWRTMISVFVGGIFMSLILNLIGINPYMTISPLTQILMGGFMFGAVFMATDPVTSAQTNTGKYIYGFLIGVLAILIRVLNPAYPEGMMLAILFMNAFAPLIDYYIIQNNIRKRLARTKNATL
ncbi:MAG: NADH:ubiquinone reductase (Na(+)-transporting) subunit B [Bacteroidales bacterium]|nr:NADH:ubiquinone reductase (Na(+)-transporting) subunit B [Bacteroidales bacterium]